MEKSGRPTVLVKWELAESILQLLWEEDGGTEGGERSLCSINPLTKKRRLLYLKTQSVPRCKHFLLRL